MSPHDTVDVLDDSNLAHLKDVIYKKIGNQELSLEDYDSDFFEHLSEIQGTEGYFRIRPEDLNDLLKDSDASNELFKKDLQEIGQELRSVYYSSENTAYEDEVYEAVYNGLNEYFEGRIDEIPRKVGEKTKYDQYIKIRDFIGNITTFLENNKGGTWSDSFLEYFGGYTELINFHLILIFIIQNQEYEKIRKKHKTVFCKSICRLHPVKIQQIRKYNNSSNRL